MSLSSVNSINLNRIRFGVHAAGCAVVVAIVTAGYGLCFAATDQQEMQWQSGIEMDQQILNRKAELLSQQSELQTELKTQQQRLTELTALIPNTPEESRFLAQMSELARTSHLQIDNFRPGRPEDSENVKRIRVQLTATASYECLCRFLDGLRALPRLTRVSRMKIEPTEVDGRYPVDLELSIFFAAATDQLHPKVAQK